MVERDIVTRVRAANAGRDPRLLLLKYQKMAADPFLFLRGSCHLFYQEREPDGALDATPRTWICADLHLENFGCVAGEGRALRLEVNDYDETLLAPAAWDLTRFLTSLFLAADKLGFAAKHRARLARAFLQAYADALVQGALPAIDARSASAPVRDELKAAAAFTLGKLLRKRTEPAGKRLRRLRLDGVKALSLRPQDRATVEACWEAFQARYPDEQRLRLADAARRISGIGSLGVGRFVLLVETGHEADPYRLLDLKRMRASAVPAAIRPRQPRWPSEAVRVAEVTRQVQGTETEAVRPIAGTRSAWLLRALQPSEQRFGLETAGLNPRGLGAVVEDMGRALAAAELRAAGWRGAAPVEGLQAFAADQGWWEPVIAEAETCARAVVADHRRFVAAVGKGDLDP